MGRRQFVIVGAGECGTRAAFALREQGFAGDITLVGAEAGYPYERPPLSKQFLLTQNESEQGPVAWISDADGMAAANIRYLPSTQAQQLDTATQTLQVACDGEIEHLQYDRLLLATGTVPRQLPLQHVAEHPHCHYLRTLTDAKAILQQLSQAKRLIIVGAGLIGLELAASARQLGVAVTVLEAGPRALGRGVPEYFAQQLSARHQAEGVNLRYGVQITAVASASAMTASGQAAVTVTLANGELLSADMLVIGIGATPNQALAEQAGLSVANGIVVNEYLQTSAAHVYAAGDCCCFPDQHGQLRRLESWRNAQAQGNLAARTMLGASEAYRAIPWFWSDQYDLGLQVAGLSDPSHQTVLRLLNNGAQVQFELDQHGTLVAAAGLGPGTSVAKEIRLAEMLISKGISPSPDQLADAAVNLKKLLK